MDREVLLGHIEALATPAWTATYEHTWERSRATVKALDAAIAAAAKGRGVDPVSSPPRWLGGLADRELARMAASSWSSGDFIRYRVLERAGVIAPEHDATYVLAFMSGFGPDRARLLREDPDLLDTTLWRLFEVEGGGEVSLTNLDRFYGGGWQDTLVELSRAGTLPRERVLVSCLEALARDFGAYQARWFSATYAAFVPTAEEKVAHQGRYLRLLASPLPATVGFAVKLLRELQKAGTLTEDALTGLRAAVLVPAKGTALDVLRLASAIDDDVALDVARVALDHPHADVQRAAAALVQKLGDSASITARADALAPSVTHDLGLPVTRDEEDAVRAFEPSPLAPAVRPEELVERCSALLEEPGDSAELDAVLAALAVLDDAQTLSPLRKRAQTAVGGRDTRGVRTAFAHLLLDGLGASVERKRQGNAQQRFVVRRLEEVARRLRAERPRTPLLSTPDLPGGFVSTGCFLSRLDAAPPDHHDLVAAVLRLDGDDLGPALDRALLADPAAAAAVQHRRAGAGVAAELVADLEVSEGVHEGKPYTHRWHRWQLTGPTDTPADDEPMLLDRGLTSTTGWLDSLGEGWVPVVAGICPHDAEHFLALSYGAVVEATSWPMVSHELPVVLDTLARHSGRVGQVATVVLASGLVAGKSDQRLAAVDAFADLVPTGRISPSDLAGVMATYAEGWTVSRWADSFRRAGEVPGCADSVLAVLTALLPALPTDSKAVTGLLDVLRDVSLRRGRTTEDPALRAWLGTLTGSSKGARTARALLG